MDWLLSQYQLLLQRWQGLGSMMDVDADIDETTYEAAIAGQLITPLRTEASNDLHNVGHGAQV